MAYCCNTGQLFLEPFNRGCGKRAIRSEIVFRKNGRSRSLWLTGLSVEQSHVFPMFTHICDIGDKHLDIEPDIF